MVNFYNIQFHLFTYNLLLPVYNGQEIKVFKMWLKI